MAYVCNVSICFGQVSNSFILVFLLTFSRLGCVTHMGLSYILVACVSSDLRRVKLLPPDW